MKLPFKLFLSLFLIAAIFFVSKEILSIRQRLLGSTTSSVTVGLVGDLGMGRYVTAIARDKKDFNWSFKKISPWLKQNDFNLGNLETPIVDSCPTSYKDIMIFCADPKFLPFLKENKFIFNLANNHILNYGQDGLKQTENYLTQSNIDFVYSHQKESEFKRIEINGISFGFLGFDLTGAHQIDQPDILTLVKKYDPQVDWLIVSLHWGQEYQFKPQSEDVDFAHQLIDTGADIIAGTHPHVFQSPETYKNKLIYYSLGNFIFDQNWSLETSHSKIIRITFTKNKIINTQENSIIIQNNSQPKLID